MVRVFGPFVEMARLQNEVNKIFETFLEVSPEASLKAVAGWVPSLDVVQTDREVIVRVEIPGVDPSGLNLAVSAGQVSVSGEKPEIAKAGNARYHCLERGQGSFSRTILLPEPVNTHQARASLREGLLTVTFPRVQNRRGGAIPIPIETE